MAESEEKDIEVHELAFNSMKDLARRKEYGYLILKVSGNRLLNCKAGMYDDPTKTESADDTHIQALLHDLNYSPEPRLALVRVAKKIVCITFVPNKKDIKYMRKDEIDKIESTMKYAVMAVIKKLGKIKIDATIELIGKSKLDINKTVGLIKQQLSQQNDTPKVAPQDKATSITTEQAINQSQQSNVTEPNTASDNLPVPSNHQAKEEEKKSANESVENTTNKVETDKNMPKKTRQRIPLTIHQGVKDAYQELCKESNTYYITFQIKDTTVLRASKGVILINNSDSGIKPKSVSKKPENVNQKASKPLPPEIREFPIERLIREFNGLFESNDKEKRKACRVAILKCDGVPNKLCVLYIPKGTKDLNERYKYIDCFFFLKKELKGLHSQCIEFKDVGVLDIEQSIEKIKSFFPSSI
ncbi:hypothetical protein RFI_13988 [Reticulomyxa filosa]|uniref:Uncharacterized protein n=1 Tax=Reticulomyxa filosa TaxID=46433 RepID=X6NCZ4_RETFI|nr:hypothetical protein RFI_13988 [Reticulomyxa filosa]|eukprot:ETO23197.1 hypothetical protein RFI_13988 [Reticulomyxa filosa]